MSISEVQQLDKSTVTSSVLPQLMVLQIPPTLLSLTKIQTWYRFRVSYISTKKLDARLVKNSSNMPRTCKNFKKKASNTKTEIMRNNLGDDDVMSFYWYSLPWIDSIDTYIYTHTHISNHVCYNMWFPAFQMNQESRTTQTDLQKRERMWCLHPAQLEELWYYTCMLAIKIWFN